MTKQPELALRSDPKCVYIYLLFFFFFLVIDFSLNKFLCKMSTLHKKKHRERNFPPTERKPNELLKNSFLRDYMRSTVDLNAIYKRSGVEHKLWDMFIG